MSIRRYLVLTLFAVLTLITFIAAVQGYKVSMTRASTQFDEQLIDVAHTLITIQSLAPQESNKSRVGVKNIDQQGSFAFQLWLKGQLVLKSANAPLQNIVSTHSLSSSDTTIEQTHFSEVNFLGQRWRALSLTNSIKEQQVIVAQPLQAQFVLAQDIILAAVKPMIIAIALLSVLIFIIITQGLKPLKKLTIELSNRKTNDFTPLELTAKNSELEHVIATLNQLFSRLDAAFERERHFAADAAHELKTPLSVLKLNAHNVVQEVSEQLAQLNSEAESSKHKAFWLAQVKSFTSIEQLTSSVDRMGHVIDQILNLNRTNPEQMASASTAFNLNKLLQQVISELYAQINKRKQNISLESDNVELVAHQLSIHLLMVNLISNANKYTPEGGEIKVTTEVTHQHADSEQISIIVEDSGQGIAPSEYHRVFDRFYRIGGDQHNSNVVGCGLGLAIVKHIADVHGALITLSSSETLKGLKVTVTFPVNAPKIIAMKNSAVLSTTKEDHS